MWLKILLTLEFCRKALCRPAHKKAPGARSAPGAQQGRSTGQVNRTGWGRSRAARYSAPLEAVDLVSSAGDVGAIRRELEVALKRSEGFFMLAQALMDVALVEVGRREVRIERTHLLIEAQGFVGVLLREGQQPQAVNGARIVGGELGGLFQGLSGLGVGFEVDIGRSDVEQRVHVELAAGGRQRR